MRGGPPGFHALIVGAAAGGGFPQWNCGCPGCTLVRSGSAGVEPRTQDSVAVSADGELYYLLNASPDILSQIQSVPALHPRAPRHSPIAGVVLTNGDLNHVLGLFSLRERQPLALYATDAVRRGLVEHNAFMRTLARFEGQATWVPLPLEEEVPLRGTPLFVKAVPMPGKLPIHLASISSPSPEDNVALIVRHPERRGRLVYASAAGAIGSLTRHLLEGDCLLFDGTFWSEDELVRLGLGTARAQDMAHLPIGGDEGSLARMRDVTVARRIFTHVNNTNPI